MAKKERKFNIKLYSVLSVIVVAVILAVVCVSTFASRYIAFHPDEVARTYVETIVQSGDGYNAYKNTLLSKNMKFGDFIRKNYIEPVVYRDVEGYYPGNDTDDLKGYNDDSFMGEKTLSDDGTLSGKLIEEMYPVYVDLVSQFGWDEYGKIFKSYTEKLVVVREEIFGDKYMSDEIFFTTFEANVASYGDMLTGTEDTFDENTGVQLSFATEGEYQKIYGADYRFCVKASSDRVVDVDEYKKDADKERFESFGVNVDDIKEVRVVTVAVYLDTDDSNELVSADVTVVKIGMSWYVDNTNTDTSALYTFFD